MVTYKLRQQRHGNLSFSCIDTYFVTQGHFEQLNYNLCTHVKCYQTITFCPLHLIASTLNTITQNKSTSQ